ncbi:MAG: tetratricopeptide repeat protein [Gammaproteobacteria bacterium]|nr:tetratricopeptide repeat protein [Gammaproteobacteria bacterium]
MRALDLRRTLAALAIAALLAMLGACAGTSGNVTKRDEPAPLPQQPVVEEQRKEIDGDMLYRLLVAEFAGRRGQLDVALDNYLSAAFESTDPRVAERAARIAVYARDNRKALLAARRWVELSPDNIEARQVIATLYVRIGDIDNAERELEQVVGLTDGGTDQGLTLVAALLGREQNHRAALDVITRLVERYPDRAVAHYSQGTLADRVGDKALALSATARAIELQPGYSDAIILRAKVLVDLGRTEEAFDSMQAALDDNPEDLPIKLGYARLLVESGQFERAAEQLRELYVLNKDNANLVYALGLLAIESRRLEDAREYMIQVLALGTRNNDANYYLGRIAESQRDYVLATKRYLLVNGGDNQLDAQIRVAEMLARLDRMEEAREHLRKLQIMNPEPNNAVRFYLAEGEILRQAGHHGEAMRVLSEALKEFPGNTDLLYARALTAEKVDRPDIVEQDLLEVLSREPDNAHALNALGYYLADHTDRLQEAKDYITRALELLPNDPAVIDSMGWLQYRLGNHEQALEYLKRAYEKLEDAEIAAHLGEVLWVTGDREAASKVWNRALEVSPEDNVLRRVMQRFKQ